MVISNNIIVHHHEDDVNVNNNNLKSNLVLVANNNNSLGITSTFSRGVSLVSAAPNILQQQHQQNYVKNT
jgi:hypothetical protein